MDCTMVCPFSLIPDKQYSVTTHFDKKLCTIKGTFSRYERNKIMFKDDYVWSIVLLDWICDELGHTYENPCKIQLYLDPIDKLEFYEIK